MLERIFGAIGTVLVVYFMFDFFFWDGGILNPSIMTRITEVGTTVLI